MQKNEAAIFVAACGNNFQLFRWRGSAAAGVFLAFFAAFVVGATLVLLA
jgi:hypothetical protein